MTTLLQRVKRIQDEVRCVEAQYGIGAWEAEFLRSVAERPALTPKQEAKLEEIERRVFPDADDDDLDDDGLE